jgi:DNA-binding CsgD family transcriptional regulator
MKPIIPLEVTRALVSIAAWWVLFYKLHKPANRARRITLLTAFPICYTAWMLIPLSDTGNVILWAAIILLFAFLAGDLRSSLFTALYYIGMEAAIDTIRSFVIRYLLGHGFAGYSIQYYIQFNLQYTVVLAWAIFYYWVMKSRELRQQPLPLRFWIITITPSFVTTVLLTLYADTARLLLDTGINIYMDGILFGLSLLAFNVLAFYMYIRLMTYYDSHLLAQTLQDQLDAYAKQSRLVNELSDTRRKPFPSHTGISMIDAMLSYKEEEAVGLGFAFQIDAAALTIEGSPAYDAASCLAMTLDCAIDALDTPPHSAGERGASERIDCEILCRDALLVIRVRCTLTRCTPKRGSARFNSISTDALPPMPLLPALRRMAAQHAGEVMVSTEAAVEPAFTLEVTLDLSRGEAGRRTALAPAFIKRYKISAAEQKVMEQLLLGKSNKEIAIDLGISFNTVHVHLQHVYQKTSAKSRHALFVLMKES